MEGKKTKAGIGLGVGSVLATLYSLDPETFMKYLGETVVSKVTQFGVCFALAAWIHGRQVRVEIKTQFANIVEALNNLGKTLENRIEKVEDNVKAITSRVETLEHPNRGIQ